MNAPTSWIRVLSRFSIWLLCGAVFATTRTDLAAQGGGITHVDTIVAESLAHNLLGDSNHRAVTVYLPPGYLRDLHNRYPVIYLLHGFSANHRAFMAGGYSNLNIRISMDSLIRAGAVKKMIVVTPNADNAFDGSFYMNSPTAGMWEDFVAHDLVSYVDSHFRTIRSRTGRGIAGHSMGGFGALRIGMRHPDVFSALYSLSPCCLDDFGDRPPKNLANGWRRLLKLDDMSQVKSAGFYGDIALAMSAGYSPNASRPPFFVDFSFRVDGDSLVPVESVRQRWHPTPIEMIPANARNLRRMAIGFDAGSEDGFVDIPANVARLDSMLTQLHIDHTAELYRGTHMSGIRERIETRMLPFFSRNLH